MMNYMDCKLYHQVIQNGFSMGSSTSFVKSKEAYNNAIDSLNEECRKYVNSSYAIEGRCVGSNPLNSVDQSTTNTGGWKETDENYEIDYNTMKTLGIHVGGGANYWLASREITTDSDGSKNYCIRHVYLGTIESMYGQVRSSYLCRIYYEGNQYKNAINNKLRPVITLYSDIQTSAGDGSSGNPYQLVAR